MSKKNLSRADRVRERRRKQRSQKIDEMPIHKPVEPIRPSNATTFIGPKKRKPQMNTYPAEAAAAMPKTREVVSSPVEFQMPSIEWRAASAFLAILLSVALYLMWTSPYFMISAPQVSGNHYVTSDEIIETLGMNGTTIFLLKPEKLGHELLLAHPSLKAVEITVSLPNVVSVAVTERQPVLIWQQDGKTAWIDEEGVAFLANGQTEGLIVVNALGRPLAPAMDESTRNMWAPPAYLDPGVVAALRALVPYVPQGASITYDPNVGLGWKDPRGWTVELGDMTEDFGLKLRLYETISNWVVANNIRPVLINVVYPHAPYYRTEP